MKDLTSHIDKLHKEELEKRKDKKINSKISSLSYGILTCIIFASIILLNLNSYDKSSGFRIFMTLLFFILIILIPILGGFLAKLHSKNKRYKKH